MVLGVAAAERLKIEEEERKREEAEKAERTVSIPPGPTNCPPGTSHPSRRQRFGHS
jgi:hypothetical protein